MGNLKYDLIKPLPNRQVILFPDAECYNSWIDKVKDLTTNVFYSISELVEEKSSAEEKEDGWDIADYILKIYKNREKE